MNANFTLVFVAPFYNRSGYGSGARALVNLWHACGMRIKIIPVDQVEEGVDDCDMDLLKSLEKTTVLGPVVAVFYHVPNQAWLNLKLPAGAIRVMFTTFDGILQGQLPPSNWIDICNQMDLVFVNESEIQGWVKAGLKKGICHYLEIPHPWIDNNILPKINHVSKSNNFRFLSIAMYQPRRRWDTLFQAFLEEFSNDKDIELYIKVNFPSWHPVPGQPRRDFFDMLEKIKISTESKASIVIDEDIGSRLTICSLIDSANCLVSTDTAITAPVDEALVRGKFVIVPSSTAKYIPIEACINIKEDPDLWKPIDDEILKYQPHHRNGIMRLLKVEDVRHALRSMYQERKSKKNSIWKGWKNFVNSRSIGISGWNKYFIDKISQELERKSSDMRVQIYWEGSQFVYHSLAHVNRQFCRRLNDSGDVKLSLIPYEKDQFDPAKDMPEMAALLECVKTPLEAPKIHVRHQWPPNFTAPAHGAWVMMQPWEFGGIPLQWVVPMRDSVDELWVPTSWVRDCYIQSGIPAEKVQVIPLGVDTRVLSPEGDLYALNTRKKFKFLFLGGTIHRKGIDIALAAYLKAFSSQDDVCLVIKGQPGQVYAGSELHDALSDLRNKRADAPEIEYITEPLSESEISSLYRSCDVLLAPYRGEGFGLPIAEAMACGLALIVTAAGASKDFVTDDFAFLLPSRKSTTKIENSQPSAPGYWLEEPDMDAVFSAMQAAYHAPEVVKIMGRRARQYAEKNLNWEIATSKMMERIKILASKVPLRKMPKKTAFIFQTDWSISELMEILVSYIHEFKPDEPVTLAFTADSDAQENFDREEAIQSISQVIQKLDLDEFPEIRVIQTVQEMMEIARNFQIQWVDKKMGSVTGLDGVTGHRLGRSRLMYQSMHEASHDAVGSA